MFAANGEIWDEDTVRRVMEIPEIKGMKHSSLDRLTELSRLALRDKHRPDFKIYTGNDLGIDMIEYGSDYLLGLATFSPENLQNVIGYGRAATPLTTHSPTLSNIWGMSISLSGSGI